MPAARDVSEKQQAPETSGVVVTSRLLAPGERQLLNLNAPQKPGDYEYLSTAPGQINTPRGILQVLP
jgi:hypothetical protein